MKAIDPKRNLSYRGCIEYRAADQWSAVPLEHGQFSAKYSELAIHSPDSKVHGDNMGPIWGRHEPCYLGLEQVKHYDLPNRK